MTLTPHRSIGEEHCIPLILSIYCVYYFSNYEIHIYTLFIE
jgi:hypothetical protein